MLTEKVYASYRADAGKTEEYTDGIKACIAEAERSKDYLVCETAGLPLKPEYRYVPVEAVGFRTRGLHFLRHAGIRTFYDFLSYKSADLKAANNLGPGTIEDMYERAKDFAETGSVSISFTQDGRSVARTSGISILMRVTLDPEPRWLPLEMPEDPEELERMKQLEQLVSANQAYFAMFCNSLRDYYNPVLAYYRSVRDMMQAASSLPDRIKGCSVGSLLRIYGLRFGQEAETLMAAWPQEMSISAVLLKTAHEDRADWLAEAESFCSWLQGLDLTQAGSYVFCKDRLADGGVWSAYVDKYWDVIIRRASGQTLEEAGSIYGDARERARQIENLAAGILQKAYADCPYDIAALMHLETGRSILSYEDAEKLLGQPAAKLFWRMAKKSLLDCGLYEYSEELKAVFYNILTGGPEDLDKVLGAMNSLPKEFYEDEKDAFIADAAKAGVPESLLEEMVPYRYRIYGQLYSASRPSVAKKCEYLLRCCFKDGYKVGDGKMAGEACRVLSEVFGKDTLSTPHALESKISLSGQLVDRGLYMYPGYVHMDYSALDEVLAYVETCTGGVVSFNELYEVFKEKLNAAGISNRYALQGAIKQHGCPYTATRDYIMKDEEGSMAAELSAYAKEKGRFTLKEFSDAFPYYNPSLLYPLAARTEDVIQIGPGLFMDAASLDYSDEEQLGIMSFIYRRCPPEGMNTDEAFPEFRTAFEPFCSRNGIDKSSAMFAVLEYMYKKYFTFSKPYILAL
ncbi:MAG: hypothetical protein LUE27_05920 [Clostridia bacterium]|nr:hypothetical protein [Clostridia bacterium]